jgi:peptidoglycan/LPS O-acetylase OafA/YrhL
MATETVGPGAGAVRGAPVAALESGVTGAGAGTGVLQAGEQRSARVESLRGIAALGVLTAHAFVFSYGTAFQITARYWHRVMIELGFGSVDVFFVLSGYLLFWPFARSAFATHTSVNLWGYAQNRVVRIAPLYYVVLTTLLLLQHHGGTGWVWWHFGLFAENFSRTTAFAIDAPMWTLAIEVQFYVALPVLAWLLARLSRRSKAWAAAILLVLAAGSIVARQLLVWHSYPTHFVWQYSLPTMFSFFAVGMLLALLRLAWTERRPRWLDGPLGHSTVWLLASVPIWLLIAWRFSLEPLGGIAAGLMIGACVLPLRKGWFVALTESWPLSRVGLTSYSIYLWQVPVIIILAGGGLTGGTFHLHPSVSHLIRIWVLAIVIVLPLAAVSYNLVEAPALRLRRRWAAAGPTGPIG